MLRIFVLFLLLLPDASWAQVITGTILGTALDQSGAAVPNARVRITNSRTGVVTDIKTAADGAFTVPYLQPGTYEVQIEADGFKSFRESKIELTLDSKYRVEAKLELGNVAESVQVTADAASLQTDSSDLNVDISQQMIESMPNIGKSPLAYIGSIAGMVGLDGFDDPENIGYNETARRTMSAFSVNGSRVLSSEFLLDGAPNTTAAFNEIAVLPNTDAIGQVKIITNAYSAEFGRVGGGRGQLRHQERHQPVPRVALRVLEKPGAQRQFLRQ
jgi:trimeric autotransporter adhesin